MVIPCIKECIKLYSCNQYPGVQGELKKDLQNPLRLLDEKLVEKRKTVILNGVKLTIFIGSLNNGQWKFAERNMKQTEQKKKKRYLDDIKSSGAN